MKTILFSLLLSITLLYGTDLDDAMRRAGELREEGKFIEAAAILQDYMKSHDQTYALCYDTACLLTLGGQRDAAFSLLEKSVDLGWLDNEYILIDTDLESLHEDPRWTKVVDSITAKRTALMNSLPDKPFAVNPVALPKPSLKSGVSIEEAMARRRSVRNYSEQALTLEEVGQVLWAAYGVTLETDPDNLRGGLKTAPSAGATYPLELYLGAWQVKDLEPGFYRYEPFGHKLYPVRLGDFRQVLAVACYNQACVANAPASLVFSAVFERTTKVYGDRGRLRYVPMDLGHSAENVYLQVESLNMGTVAVGAFDDLKLQLAVPMTRSEEPLYVMPLGRVKR